MTVDGKRQVLTHFEFELLSLLATAAGRVLSREHLMDALKGEEFESFDRSIDVHISKLRAKLEHEPEGARATSGPCAASATCWRDDGVAAPMHEGRAASAQAHLAAPSSAC